MVVVVGLTEKRSNTLHEDLYFKALRPVPPSRKTGWSLSLGEAVAGVVAELGKEEEEAVVVAVVMQMV